MALQHVDGVMACSFALVSQIENRRNLAEGQTRRLGVSDEAKTINRHRTVRPITVLGSIGLGQDPGILVEPDGLGGNPHRVSKLSNSHHQSIALDLPVDWKVYNGAMQTVSLQVPEVHCDHCKMSIEGAVAQLPGVERVDVAIEDATVSIDFGDPADLEAIKQTIEDQGYAVFG